MADEFFSQAQAEMRAAELRATARRFGGVAIGVAVIALIGVGGWQWQIHRHHQAQAEASGRYYRAMEALQAPQPDAALRAQSEKENQAVLADLASTAPGATRSFSAIRLAQLMAQKGDMAGARKAWQGVIDTADVNPSLKALARLLLLNSHINDADVTETRKQLELLAASSGPWRAFAQESLVALDLRADASPKQHDEAHSLLLGLAQSPDAPDGVRQRASILLQTFGGAG
ncbi:tetratricopeptide repeat protein [Asaia prunellae]|uniref:tetratricopeptide repeat protein n=1 Tax=Asaia prunellae TaxID=610245 RepID=UPI00046EC3D7|nr:tetratricopeptide repeat protein [Asaia prunellae]